jgi:hypothetical protein
MNGGFPNSVLIFAYHVGILGRPFWALGGGGVYDSYFPQSKDDLRLIIPQLQNRTRTVRRLMKILIPSAFKQCMMLSILDFPQISYALQFTRVTCTVDRFPNLAQTFLQVPILDT